MNNSGIPVESYISFAAMLVAFFTIAMLWEFRKSMEVKYLIFVEALAAVWALTSGLEFLSKALEQKILWAQISYFGIAFLPVCYFLFTIAFSQKYKIITPRVVALLSLIPLLTIPLVLTNDLHHLVWKRVLPSDEGFNTIIIEYNFWFWIFWAYSFILIVIGLYNLFLSMYEFTDYYKSQVRTLLIATSIPVIGNMMYITGLNPMPGLDWTPVLFIFTGLIISYGIIRYSMFNLVPIARNDLIDTMNDGFLIVNADGFIEDYNPAIEKIFNINRSLKQKKLTTAFSKYNDLLVAIKKGKNTLLEVEDAEGKKSKTYQVKIKPVYNRTNILYGYLVQLNNVTSLKSTENKLKQVNKKLEAEVEERGRLIEDLDAFAHTVAHDLKNSLGSIYNASEIMEECIREGNTEMLNEFSGDIRTSAKRAMHITHELLLLATVNHHEIEKTTVEMGPVFNKALRQLKDLIKETGARITYPDEWPQAVGYAPWIEEIWTNYLTNSLKYGGKPPVIRVGAEAGKHYTRFWIRDNGNGIQPADQNRLFKKYSRLSPEVAEGHGLGLSIVKRIVHKLCGYVGVESSGKKGEGACFWFELPVTQNITATYENRQTG